MRGVCLFTACFGLRCMFFLKKRGECFAPPSPPIGGVSQVSFYSLQGSAKGFRRHERLPQRRASEDEGLSEEKGLATAKGFLRRRASQGEDACYSEGLATAKDFQDEDACHRERLPKRALPQEKSSPRPRHFPRRLRWSCCLLWWSCCRVWWSCCPVWWSCCPVC